MSSCVIYKFLISFVFVMDEISFCCDFVIIFFFDEVNELILIFSFEMFIVFVYYLFFYSFLNLSCSNCNNF